MATKNTINQTQIDFIPGMPPAQPMDDIYVGPDGPVEGIGDKTNTVVKNSMPLVRIYPGIPSFTKGASIFTRKPFFEAEVEGTETNYLSYKDLLNSHGFSLSSNFHKNHLTLAYLADSFPTDSFTNEYGENFLQGLTDISSTTVSSLAQMFGVRTGKEALGKVTKAAKKAGGIFELGAAGVEKGAGAVGKFLEALPIAGGTNIVSSLAAGARLDFPMVWKASGFQPSYTMTVRLYNPYPGSQEATNRYIAGPIAAIMLLGMPISADKSGSTYSWPFIHRIWSPGIYDLDPAYISNITIIKGGDQQQIAYNQRLGIVDVRIDFGSLYSSMLATKLDITTRPTLKSYIKGISGPNSQKFGIQNFSSVGQTKEEIEINQKNKNQALALPKTITKAQAPTTEELTTEEINNPPDRVSSSAKQISANLELRTPAGLISISIN